MSWEGPLGQPNHLDGPRGNDTSPMHRQGGGEDLLQVLCSGKSPSSGDRIDGEKQAEGEMVQTSRKCFWGTCGFANQGGGDVGESRCSGETVGRGSSVERF